MMTLMQVSVPAIGGLVLVVAMVIVIGVVISVVFAGGRGRGSQVMRFLLGVVAFFVSLSVVALMIGVLLPALGVQVRDQGNADRAATLSSEASSQSLGERDSTSSGETRRGSAWDPVVDASFEVWPHATEAAALRALGRRVSPRMAGELGLESGALVWINPVREGPGLTTIQGLDEAAKEFAGALGRVEPWRWETRVVLGHPRDDGTPTLVFRGRVTEETFAGTTLPSLRTFGAIIERDHVKVAEVASYVDAAWAMPIAGDGLRVIGEVGEAQRLRGVYRTHDLADSPASARRMALEAAADDLADRYAASRETLPKLRSRVLETLLDEPQLQLRSLTQEISRPYGELYRTATELEFPMDRLTRMASELEMKLLEREQSVTGTWAAVVGVIAAIVLAYLVLNVATQGYYTYTLAIAGLLGAGIMIILATLWLYYSAA
ncbi:MAG: hypothetical protein RLN76_00115 [Phycisphaeraceae bacterium]